jgi:hypothetical protein
LINGSASKDYYNSPLGIALSINLGLDKNANHKPAVETLEQTYLIPFDEIVKNNLDDIEYVKRIGQLHKRRYEFLDTIARQGQSKKGKGNRLRDLEEAMKRDRARRNGNHDKGLGNR